MLTHTHTQPPTLTAAGIGYLDFLPLDAEQAGGMMVLRILRLFRVFRLAKSLPALRAVVQALLSGMGSVRSKHVPWS